MGRGSNPYSPRYEANRLTIRATNRAYRAARPTLIHINRLVPLLTRSHLFCVKCLNSLSLVTLRVSFDATLDIEVQHQQSLLSIWSFQAATWSEHKHTDPLNSQPIELSYYTTESRWTDDRRANRTEADDRPFSVYPCRKNNGRPTGPRGRCSWHLSWYRNQASAISQSTSGNWTHAISYESRRTNHGIYDIHVER